MDLISNSNVREQIGSEIAAMARSLYPSQKQVSSQKDAPTTSALAGVDSSQLSSRSRELAHAHQVMFDAEEIRNDRLAALQSQIAGGTYKVQPEGLADQLLAEVM